jgi:hypothetical protein
VDHLGVLLGRPFLEAEEVPDTVEQLGSEPAVEVEILGFSQRLLL